MTKSNQLNRLAFAQDIYHNELYIADHVWLRQVTLKFKELILEPTLVQFTAVCYLYGNNNCAGLKQIQDIKILEGN